MAENPKINGRIDIDSPRWDQSTFFGRWKHFAWMTDYRTAIIGTNRLHEAKDLLQQYRLGTEPPGTTDEQIWYAKKLYASAFHPDTGDLQNVIGRMSFQVPGGMILTAGMLQFYKTNFSVVLWQWMNQSFNALVNYTNRNAATSMSTQQMGIAYGSATSAALVMALGLKAFLSTRAPPLVQRFVPYAAVVAANLINIPLTRQRELAEGVILLDENGNRLTESRYAAVKGISQVCLCRIIMAGPGMTMMPFIMEHLEKKPWFMRYVKFHLVFQTIMVGAFLTAMVPLACAIYPQNSSITPDALKRWEPEKYEELKKQTSKMPAALYFNKGL